MKHDTRKVGYSGRDSVEFATVEPETLEDLLGPEVADIEIGGFAAEHTSDPRTDVPAQFVSGFAVWFQNRAREALKKYDEQGLENDEIADRISEMWESAVYGARTPSEPDPTSAAADLDRASDEDLANISAEQRQRLIERLSAVG